MQPSLVTLARQFYAPRHWPTWLFLACLRVLAWLPLPWVYALGAGIGEAVWWLHPARRRITRRNLAACFPARSNAERRRLARAHFRILAVAAVANGVAWWGSRALLERLTRFRGREIFEQARQRGENIILLVPHCAGLEYGGIRLSALAPTLSLYQRNKKPLLNALIHRHRSRFGAQQYALNTPVKSLIAALRHNHVFYYLPDQDPGRWGGRLRGVFAPFYGVPTATFSAPGRLARLVKATVIPCTTRILPRGRGFEITFAPPLVDYPCGDLVRDATTMNRALESLIAHAPEQYFWSHRRFKTRPEGEADFYG